MTGIGVVDFTNPEATKWYQEKLGRIIDMGVDYVKTDFGERLPVDVVYYDGSDPRKMHNYYPYLYNKAIYDLLEEKNGRGSACVFSRSATVGTQQFPVNWGGDNESSYISMRKPSVADCHSHSPDMDSGHMISVALWNGNTGSVQPLGCIWTSFFPQSSSWRGKLPCTVVFRRRMLAKS